MTALVMEGGGRGEEFLLTFREKEGKRKKKSERAGEKGGDNGDPLQDKRGRGKIEFIFRKGKKKGKRAEVGKEREKRHLQLCNQSGEEKTSCDDVQSKRRKKEEKFKKREGRGGGERRGVPSFRRGEGSGWHKQITNYSSHRRGRRKKGGRVPA